MAERAFLPAASFARRKFRRLPVVHFFQSRSIDLGIDGAPHSDWEVAALGASGDTVGKRRTVWRLESIGYSSVDRKFSRR
jgi:hypothetical protein